MGRDCTGGPSLGPGPESANSSQVSRSGLWIQEGGPVTTYFWALATLSLPQGRIWVSVLSAPPQGRAGRATPLSFSIAGIYSTPQGQLGPKEVPHTP